MTAETWQGIVLVGGASRRMGQAKALIARDGISQAAYLAALLEAALNRPAWFVGALPGLPPDRFISDREPGAGPLSALLGAFDAAADANLIVLACDLFRFDRPALDWLLQWRAHTAPSVWPRLPQRPFGEPLAALYRTAAKPTLDASWRQGCRALHQALPAALRFEPELPDHLVLAYRGANTPDELHALYSASPRTPSQ